jgi:adenylosuccinate lyase
MPHKVNPIDFENAEGNLGVANALWTHFSQKLPISRLQRDLTDSTVLRCIGVAAGHTLIAHESLLKAISRIDINCGKAEAELEENWAVLAEAVQTVMRKHNIPNAYEKIKEVTRGQEFDKAAYFDLVAKFSPEIGTEDTERLNALSPSSYLGYAPFLATRACL